MEFELQIITKLLNLQDYFVKEVKIIDNKIYITIERKDYPLCPHCGQYFMGSSKDSRLQTIEDLSVFGRRCYLKIYKFRIDCSCGFKGTENIKWLDPHERSTNRYSKWIYTFCKRMTCIDVARIFGISKHKVYRLDKKGIEEELKKQKPITPEKISIDEISRKKGHRYATIITAPDEKKILDVKKGRKTVNLAEFYKEKGDNWCNNIKFVSMDAWLAFRKATKKYCKKAQICFDHFHLAQHFSKAIDKLRIYELKKAKKSEKEVYKGSRWLLLKRPENLKEKQKYSLARLLELNMNLYKAYIIRDEFRQIFAGHSAHSRLIRLTNWIKKAKGARISQITAFVKQIEKWSPYIRNSLRDNNSNSFAEGINTKIRVIQRMAYGYKDFEYLRLKIIQQFNFRDVKSIFDG